MLLAAALLATLSACGSRNPAALTQTAWEDPTPEIRGSIENGVYTNNWLNLTKHTTTDPAFLEEYNRASCMADPQRNRWCELYEYYEDGYSLILTVEQLPQGTTLDQAAQAYAEGFRSKLKDTEDGIYITVDGEETDTDYAFREYTCTVYQFIITTRCESTRIEEKTADLFFWEKDGYLVELQIIDNGSHILDELFPSDEQPEPSQPATQGGDLSTLLDGTRSWIGQWEYEGYTYNLHYVFEEDGACYFALSEMVIYSAGMGTYTVDGNNLTLNIRMGGKTYNVTYAFNPDAFSLTVSSEAGLVAEKGYTFILEEDMDNDAEKIKHFGEYYAEGIPEDEEDLGL